MDQPQSKSEVISKHRQNPKDTGSPEVQIAIWTAELAALDKHFAANPKDNHSRRGMLRLVAKRTRMLRYLKESDVTRYRNLVATLGLRK